MLGYGLMLKLFQLLRLLFCCIYPAAAFCGCFAFGKTAAATYYYHDYRHHCLVGELLDVVINSNANGPRSIELEKLAAAVTPIVGK